MTFSTFNFTNIHPEFKNILIVEKQFSTKPSFGKIERDTAEKAYEKRLIEIMEVCHPDDFIIEPILGFEPEEANLLLLKTKWSSLNYYVLWQAVTYAGVNSLDLVQQCNHIDSETKQFVVSGIRTIAELKYKQTKDRDINYGWAGLGNTHQLTPIWQGKNGIGYAPRVN
jgi:hypothetical protein